MSKPKVIFVTYPNGYFGSAGQSWLSLSIDRISKDLKNNGYDVAQYPVNELIGSNDITEDDIVVYTSSENEALRNYIKDIVFMISKKCKVVPNFDLLMAHENKGFQELYRKTYGFGNIKGSYNIDHDNLPSKFPYVYKSITGAGSSGVTLVRNLKERKEIVNEKEKVNFKRYAISIARKLKLTTAEYSIYKYNKKSFIPYVTQSFIEGLSFDYKVLVFWDKLYVLKRNIRKNDFRASGSGLLKFTEPPEILLDYALDIFSQLDTPYASLDICISESGCHLIEFQALNFGPYALKKSPGFYYKSDGNWQFKKQDSNLEDEFSRSIFKYIDALVV